MSSASSSSKNHTCNVKDTHSCDCVNCQPKEARTIVLAFDGTGDKFDRENTNVVKLCGVLDMQHPQQLVYYQPGIGTYTPPGVRGSLKGKVAKFMDTCFGWYLDQHVMDGYEFLMNHHQPRDKICIFGFSRGAYTARALAGMLHHVGLLSQGNHEQVPNAYRIYKDKDRDLAERYKKTFCKEVTIDMLGVWDTVGSVGYIWPQALLPYISNRSVRVFRHAISIDEHRKRFGVELWDLKNDDPDNAHDHTNCELDQDVQEVWFAGCHCDIGGGNTDDAETDKSKLANISLRWMLKEIHTHSSVIFKDDLLDFWNIPTDCIDRPSHIKRIGDSKTVRGSSGATKAGTTTRHSKIETDITLANYDDEDKNPRIESCLKHNKPQRRKDIVSLAEQDRSDYTNADVIDEMSPSKPWWYIAQAFVWKARWIDWKGNRKFPQHPDWEHSKIHYSVWHRIAGQKVYEPRAVNLKEPLSKKDQFVVGEPGT
ncbi:hypothetical protein CPB86DRAFT_819847 [Serendipita vermifera]|nr:hypothetical protein CPB86DRAFT_819847 [Serendipita vermifera]